VKRNAFGESGRVEESDGRDHFGSVSVGIRQRESEGEVGEGPGIGATSASEMTFITIARGRQCNW
jgi:hypothetical protein